MNLTIYCTNTLYQLYPNHPIATHSTCPAIALVTVICTKCPDNGLYSNSMTKCLAIGGYLLCKPEKKRLLDQVRDKVRLKHYSLKTERVYVGWIKVSLPLRKIRLSARSFFTTKKFSVIPL